MGLFARAMVAFEDEARGWIMPVRFGFWVSATEGSPDVRPDLDGLMAVLAFARELAVGARSDDVRLRKLG